MADARLGIAATLATPVLIVGLLVGAVATEESEESTEACSAGGPALAPAASAPAGDVAGYGQEQLDNALAVLKAGADAAATQRDQVIAVMTAMGESSLRVLDHGDDVGPDSRGLFQQRGNGAWGSYEDRMDPYTSARSFYRVLLTKDGRGAITPSTVAHLVQRNADPFHYKPYWAPAIDVVEALTGVATGLPRDPNVTGCAALTGEVASTGWAKPGSGPITSPFGTRLHPIDGVWRLHAGVDLNGGGCGGPIYAARDGVVTFRGFDKQGNGTLLVDHGDAATAYLHIYDGDFLVAEGDEVLVGQQIARVGSSGKSRGCHLHFEVRVAGEAIDPVPFMAERGVDLSQ